MATDDSAPARGRAFEGVRAEVGTVPAIEGLRGVAIAWVMAFHWFVLREAVPGDAFVAFAKGWAPLEAIVKNGYLGVDLFFVITGFLLTLPWFRHAGEGRPAPGASAFYARRARRILPAYGVQLVLLFFVAVPLLHPRLWMDSTPYVAGNLGAHAFFLHYFTPLTSSSLGLNGALWTLAIEMQYYLLVPLVAPAFVRWPWRSLAVAAFVAGGWRWLAWHEFDAWVRLYLKLSARAGVPEEAIRHLLATQLPAWSLHFALGILAGRAWLARGGGFVAGARAALPVAAVILCAALLLWRLQGGLAFLGEHGWVAYPVLVGAIFAGIVALPTRLTARVLGASPLAGLGRVSYSAYLYHLPLLLFANAFWPGSATWAWAAWIAAVVGAATLSWRCVERPALR